MIDYSKVMKSKHTTYDWQIEMHKRWEKEREQKEKEEAVLAAKKKEEEERKTEEFIKPYIKYPVPEEDIKHLKSIPPSLRRRIKPVFILDKEGNIISLLHSVGMVATWIYENGYRNKLLGRTTIYEYIRNETAYKDQLYFVPVKKYEEFIKKLQ